MSAPNYLSILRDQLLVDEGERKEPYLDTEGNITIGVGRNLTAVGISQDEQDLMLTNDMWRANNAARALFRSFDNLTPTRKAVLCNMAFNMGLTALSGFHGTIAAVEAGDYNLAADNMLASLWARQVGDRAKRLAALMRSG